jgi:hypothetical protein
LTIITGKKKPTEIMATITDTRGHAASTTPVLEKKPEQKKQLVSPGISLVAGAMGGATEAIVTVSFILRFNTLLEYENILIIDISSVPL